MSDSDKSATSSENSGQGQENWLDRLRAAVGLKAPASIRDERVDDIMVPRPDIEAVGIDIHIGELLSSFLASGHSRMPVFRDSLDDPVGFVHIKDLMGYVTQTATPPPMGDETAQDAPRKLDLARVDLGKPLADTGLVRNILFVPPSMPVALLLASMQASRMQLALVIDEYGGTDGLVSLEDAVEMIVGDIEDESDEDTGPMIVRDGKGGFLADARADLDELAAAIGEDVAGGASGEDVDTVGGLVF